MRKISLSKKKKVLSKTAKIVISASLAGLIVLFSTAVALYNNYHVYETTVVSPTCESNGYTETVCKICHKLERTNYTHSLGHVWDEIKVTKKPTELDFGEQSKNCKRCNNAYKYPVRPTVDMKVINYSGEAFEVDSTTLSADGTLAFYDGKSEQNFPVTLTYLETANGRYAKHDIYFTFYTSASREKKKEVSLIDGYASSRWELYANYFDDKNVRADTASEIFRKVRATSGVKPVDSRLDSTFGTVKSEPVVFYINGVFSGVYQIYVPFTEKSLKVTANDTCAVVRATNNGSQTCFASALTDEGAWEILYCSSGEEDTQWVYTSFGGFIDFVRKAEPDEFKARIEKYVDKDAFIDYMLTVYNLCASENISKNLTFITYDGVIWTPVLFNADAVLGLDFSGDITARETELIPSIREKKDTDGDDFLKIDSGTYSRLFEKMFNAFEKEIKERYNKVKDTVFSPTVITSIYNSEVQKDGVPTAVYQKEAKTYPRVDTSYNFAGSVSEFIAMRKNIFTEFFK